MVAPTQSTVLDRFLDPVAACLTREVAERIVNLRLDPAFQSHIDQLAERANQGVLSEIERSEYEEIVEGIDLLAILKAKARQALHQRGA